MHSKTGTDRKPTLLILDMRAMMVMPIACAKLLVDARHVGPIMVYGHR